MPPASRGKCAAAKHLLSSVRIYASAYRSVHGLRIGRNLPQDIALSVASEILLLMEGGAPEHFRLKWWAGETPVMKETAHV